MDKLKMDLNYPDISIHDLETISYRGYFVFSPEYYDEKLKEDIKIAIAKYVIGLESFDYTKKKYFDSNTESVASQKKDNPFKLLLQDITRDVWDLISEGYGSFNRIQLKEESAITLGLVSTFGRLIKSYEASLFLLKNHYYFESFSVNRLIFEQLNYCFNLIHLDNNDFNSLSKNQIRQRLSPTDINKLKDFMPGSEIGRFYSYLSEITHIDYKQIGRYLSYSDEIDGYAVTMKSITQSIESALVLLKIVDIHLLVYEYAFKDFCDIELKYLTVSDSDYSFNPKRKSKKLVFQYNKQFEKLLDTEKIDIKYTDSRKNVDDDVLPF